MIQIHLQRNDPHTLVAAQPTISQGKPFQPFGDDGLTFADVVDLVNPLQHIPVLGSLYRKLTGDAIDPAMRIAGGALYGGPLGATFSAAAVVIAEARKADSAPQSESTALAGRDKETSTSLETKVNSDMTRDEGSPIGSRANDADEVGTLVQIMPRLVDAEPEIRRGGWMVVHAYGEAASIEPPTQSGHKRSVDVAA